VGSARGCARRIRKRETALRAQGYKLRGRWTLIKLRKTEKEWLLIKERDEYVSTEPYSNESVLSGLTNDELRNAKQRASRSRKSWRSWARPNARCAWKTPS